MKIIRLLILPCLLVLACSFLASCSLTVQKEKRRCYKQLKEFSNKHWKFSNNDSTLIDDPILYDVVISKGGLKSCAKNLTKNEIQRIFGKPHEISAKNGVVSGFYYFTILPCYPALVKASICTFYVFEFNAKGICTSFTTGGVQRSH